MVEGVQTAKRLQSDTKFIQKCQDTDAKVRGIAPMNLISIGSNAEIPGFDDQKLSFNETKATSI